MSNDLETLIGDPSKPICLFGTVPPRLKTPWNKVRTIAQNLSTLIANMGVDAIAIYDIQDEPGRDEQKCRPFPFQPCHDPRAYAKLLKEFTNIETIVYIALPYHTPQEFRNWLDTCKPEYNCNAITLVGGTPKPNGALTVAEAAEIARGHPNRYLLGGITLPERHRDKGNEPELILSKTKWGIRYFTSQVVYNADNVISLLRQYAELMGKKKEEGPMARIILTFAPFGREDTVAFLQWLGVELPKGTIRRVLCRGSPSQCVQEAIEICRENLKRILEYCLRYNIDVPLGFTAESVSKYKEEIEGVSELFKVLKEELDDYYEKKRKGVSA